MLYADQIFIKITSQTILYMYYILHIIIYIIVKISI